MERPDLSACGDPQTVDRAARLAAIRARLPGQQLRERIDTARAAYGPTYTLVELRQKVADSLPQRLGFTRGAALEPIDQYRDRVPDDALLKYDDAARSGLFSNFWVARPTYYRDVQVDPWIVAEITGTDLYVVIAHWAA